MEGTYIIKFHRGFLFSETSNCMFLNKRYTNFQLSTVPGCMYTYSKCFILNLERKNNKISDISYDYTEDHIYKQFIKASCVFLWPYCPLYLF
jgi:hypothetical protein